MDYFKGGMIGLNLGPKDVGEISLVKRKRRRLLAVLSKNYLEAKRRS